ncbi:RDD family protein [Brevibacillus migulae]|uniref:RDD family protein n=1 Tax=Brevibacillus migulae TaxID=1644114 RepID=UPI00106DF5D2|nr:RDD family protein [Brevibacillus migulae]
MNEEQYEPMSTVAHRYAGFWIRVAATLIDSLFLVGISFLLFNPLRRLLGYPEGVYSPIDVVELIVNFLYFVLLTWWSGQTLGKMLVGIRVIHARNDGGRQRLSLGQVILREVIGKLLSSIPFGLGYLWVGWNEKKRGWHDMIANTFVIKERKK